MKYTEDFNGEFECQKCGGNLEDINFFGCDMFSINGDYDLVAELECDGCNSLNEIIFKAFSIDLINGKEEGGEKKWMNLKL